MGGIGGDIDRLLGDAVRSLLSEDIVRQTAEHCVGDVEQPRRLPGSLKQVVYGGKGDASFTDITERMSGAIEEVRYNRMHTKGSPVAQETMGEGEVGLF